MFDLLRGPEFHSPTVVALGRFSFVEAGVALFEYSWWLTVNLLGVASILSEQLHFSSLKRNTSKAQ